MTPVSGSRMIFKLFKLEQIYNSILFYLIQWCCHQQLLMPQSQTAGQPGMAP